MTELRMDPVQSVLQQLKVSSITSEGKNLHTLEAYSVLQTRTLSQLTAEILES